MSFRAVRFSVGHVHLIWQVILKLLIPFRYSEDTYWGNVKKKPNLESIKVFGCSAFVHVAKSFRGKIDRTSQKRIFLGSSENSKTYFVGIPNDKGIITVRKSRNVTFNKNEMFIEVKEMEKELVNKHQSESDIDSKPVAFLGVIVSKELLLTSIDETIKDKNW